MPLDTSLIKVGIYLAIITALIGFWTYTIDNAKDKGYAEGVLSVKEANEKALADVTAKLEDEKQAAKKDRDARDEAERKLQEILRKPVPVKVSYVEVIKEVPVECRDLGPGIKRMWNYWSELSRQVGH